MATDAAPAPAREAAAEAPSTGQAITADRARSIMQEAYRRSRGEGAPASLATALEDGAAAGAVDNPAEGGAQSAPTPATPPAPSRRPPAPKPPADEAPDQRPPTGDQGQPAAPEAPAAAAEPPSPPSEAEPSGEGEASAERTAQQAPPGQTGRTKAAAVLEQEEFQTEAWQRAFQARPDLRRTVPGIVLNANLTPGQQASQLHAKLEEGLQEASAQEQRRENLRALRDVNPAAYADVQRQQEAEQAQLDLLTRQATLVMAAAAGADPDDPAFLEAGPQEGEPYEVGLERLGRFFVEKGGRVRDYVDQQRQAWDEAKAAEISALKAQFEKDKAAAVEQALGQARSPFGRFQPPPRATGNGVVPVGERDGQPGGGTPPTLDLRNPTGAIRGALGEGYRRRGASE